MQSTVFQSREAATGKVRSTMVEKRVCQTISDDDDDDDDDRHYFRNVYTHIQKRIHSLDFTATHSNIVRVTHMSQNDVSPRDFFKLTSE